MQISRTRMQILWTWVCKSIYSPYSMASVSGNFPTTREPAFNMSRQGLTHEKWDLIQNLIGPADKWPFFIRRNFPTPGLKHWDKIMLVTFAFVNGLAPELLMEWVELMDLARDRAAKIILQSFIGKKYEKRLLLRCIHHFKSDLINNMDHMRISGNEPSSVF